MPEAETSSPEITTPPPEEPEVPEEEMEASDTDAKASDTDTKASDTDAKASQSDANPLLELETQLESTVATLASLLTQLDDLDPSDNDSENGPEAITEAEHARDTAQARLNLLRIQREKQTVQTKLHAVQENWDESVDGPVPISPEPLPLEDETDDRTVTERLLEAYARSFSRTARTTLPTGGRRVQRRRPMDGRTERGSNPRLCRIPRSKKKTKKTRVRFRTRDSNARERNWIPPSKKKRNHHVRRCTFRFYPTRLPSRSTLLIVPS